MYTFIKMIFITNLLISFSYFKLDELKLFIIFIPNV
jgi:hypothetical protein